MQRNSLENSRFSPSFTSFIIQKLIFFLPKNLFAKIYLLTCCESQQSSFAKNLFTKKMPVRKLIPFYIKEDPIFMIRETCAKVFLVCAEINTLKKTRQEKVHQKNRQKKCTENRRGAKKIDEFFFWAKNSLKRSIPLVIYRLLANAIRQQVVVTVKLRQKKKDIFLPSVDTDILDSIGCLVYRKSWAFL